MKFKQECSSEEAGEEEGKIFNVVDAFSVPRLTYSGERKKYLPDKMAGRDKEPSIYAGNIQDIIRHEQEKKIDFRKLKKWDETTQ